MKPLRLAPSPPCITIFASALREILGLGERSMLSFRICSAAALAVASLSTAAQASVTVATFDDPSSSSLTSLFQRNGILFTGGYNGLGLTLQTPGTPAPDFPDATFTITPLTIINDFGPFAQLSGGTIQFFDDLKNPILRIDFTGASLSNILSLGASDFLAQGVTFSGPIVASFPGLTDEQFGFSFANPVVIDPQHYTVTSAFTSSATVTPTPAALSVLGLGGLVAARRRRAAR
jgi:MYXO-CTERM domain-containing protein